MKVDGQTVEVIGPRGGVRATARELGVTRQEAQRAIAIAIAIASIEPEAREAAREAGLDDNQSALLRIAAAKPRTPSKPRTGGR